ncbi:MAG TPA: hypothetical protein VE326_11355 [Candidatus Binatia bacterium]|nr:hypothetical protein [Candidatus Binatia bacterium]
MTSRVPATRRLRYLSAAFVTCMFTVAALARFIRPGGNWATWTALTLCGVSFVLLSIAFRDAKRVYGDHTDEVE